jgi:glycosyltransferase involved in cell wall biosynthesis
MPLVSFVCPNKDKATYIPDALRTLTNQTLQDIEIIIVDNDSTDDSRDIIDTFAHKDKRIIKKYISFPFDMPPAVRIDEARNIGNRMASSDIICVADIDDWYMPNRAEITYGKLKENPQCDMFYGAYLQRDRFGNLDDKLSDHFPAVEFSKERLKETGFFCIGHNTVGYRKKLILKYPYNTDGGVGDWGMFYNLLIKHNIKTCFTEEPLTIYRVYNNSERNLLNKQFKDYLFEKKQKKMELMGELNNEEQR